MKSWYPITFEGGLNNDANPRDLKDNELSEAKDVVVSDLGKLKVMGNFNVLGLGTLTHVDDIERGYGLFRFDSDYSLTSTTTSKNLFALSGYSTGNNFITAIYDSDYTFWSTALGDGLITINSSTETSGFIPVNYYIDGGLRISDGGFSTNSSNYWFGHIERTHFEDASLDSTDSYSSYYSYVNSLASPTRGLAGNLTIASADGTDANTLTETGFFAGWTAAQIDGLGYLAVNTAEGLAVEINSRTNDNTVETDALSGGDDDDDFTGDSVSLYSPAGTGFCLEAVATGTDGSWDAGEYEFSETFIYDGVQESLPYTMAGTVTLTAGQYFNSSVKCTSPFNPRISGGRIYTRIKDSYDAWVLLFDIDLRYGIRMALESDFFPWSENVLFSGTNYFVSDWNQTIYNKEPNVETYQSLNGFDPGKYNTLTAQYKTAVIVNRMAYIGNVFYDGVKYEDAIFKSYPNRFDTFTLDRRLEIVRGDGESIVKLEEFADRILVFKEINMYILNVSQEIEFLEAKFDFRGVKYPYQTFRTEFGVIWANEFGAYLYDGEQVYDLLLDRTNPMRRKISMSVWQSHWDSTGIVGFDANEKRAYFFADINSSSNEDVYVYDFVMGAWTEGINKLKNASYKISNFVTNWNGSMMMYADDDIINWNNTLYTSTGISVKKEVAFGNPAQAKRFYGLNITHKEASTNTFVKYGLDGTTKITSSFSTSKLTNDSSYLMQEFRIPTSGMANCNSASFRVYGACTATSDSDLSLVVDDVSFLFRPKGNR